MPPFNILEKIRQMFTRRNDQPGKTKRTLRLVQLEDRRMLNGALNLGANPGIVLTNVALGDNEGLTIADGGMVDLDGDDGPGVAVQTIRLTLATGTWSAIDPELGVVNGQMLTVDASVFANGGQALAAGDVLQIVGDAQSNSVVLNFDDLDSGDNFDFVPSGGISFAGGEGDPEVDSLTLIGYSVNTLTVNHVGLEDGNVVLEGIGTISFSQIEPLALAGNAVDLVINLPIGADATVTLSDDGGIADPDATQDAGFSAIDGAFEFTQFLNPTNSLTINDSNGDGVKIITILGLDAAFDADVTILEPDAIADNTVTFAGAIDLNGENLFVEGRTINVEAAVVTGGGNVDLEASQSVTSTVGGTINTQGIIANQASGSVDIDTLDSSVVGNVNLQGDIITSGFGGTSNGGLVTIDTLNGSITVAVINASGAAAGNGANILLNADGTDSDVIVNGLLTTTNPGVVTITADDSVTISGTGSIRVFGAGSVSVTSNTAATNGNSNDGITMAGASSVETDSGTITLQSTGANGGDITAQTLTTLNALVTINSGAGVALQNAVTTRGANVAIDAVGGVASTAAGDISTAGTALNQNSGLVDINAGGTVNLQGDIITSGFGGTSNGGLVTIDTLNGSITVAVINASGAAAGNGADVGLHANGSGGDITLNEEIITSATGIVRLDSSGRIIDGSSNANVDITASQVLLRAVEGVGDGGLSDSGDLTIASVAGSTSVLVAAETQRGDINLHSTVSGIATVGMVVGDMGLLGTIATLNGGLRITDTASDPTTDDNVSLVASAGGIVINSEILNSDAGDDNGSPADDITILAQTILTINANVTALDGVEATEEAIRLTTQAGNITFGNNVTISTDDDPVPSSSVDPHSDSASLDSIRIQAGASGDMLVRFGNNDTLRTDGGVANRFYDRLVPGGPGTSFFSSGGVPILSTVARSGVDYVVTFSVTINSPLEENLRMTIDWRDPTGTRVESIDFLTPGVYSVSHVYSFFDFQAFVDAGNNTFLVDFSVSHHQSVQVLGGTVQQGGGPMLVVPGGVISSTDNPNTPPAVPPVPPGLAIVEIVTDNDFSNRDFFFDAGMTEIKIPTLFLPPITPESSPPAPLALPVAIPNLVVPIMVIVAPVEVAETPFSSYSTQSQDYFQLRIFDGETRKIVEGYEHIRDEFGELLLQPARLKQWVADENLQDQPGLELWLITEKRTSNGPVTVERPVLKFDIANGQPFPAKEPMPSVFEELQLRPMPLDDNLNIQSPETPEGPAAPSDEQSSEKEGQPQDGNKSRPEADRQSLVIPLYPDGGALKTDAEPDATVSSTMGRSILTSVAVAAVLNQSRTASFVPSKSRQLLNRILNRQL